MLKIAIAIETKDRRFGGQTNYIEQTLRNLCRSGVFTSPHFAGLVIVGSGGLCGDVAVELSGIPYSYVVTPDNYTRQQNGARAIREGAKIPADWTLKLEDDIDFIDDFLGSTARWIENHPDLPPMVTLGFALERVSEAHYKTVGETIFGSGESFPNARRLLATGVDLVKQPVSNFWGAQAILFRRADAQSLADWLGDDPFYDDGVEQHRVRGHDLLLQRWLTSINVDHVVGPLPAFVQHIGRQSTISNPFFEFPWPGRVWSYGKRLIQNLTTRKRLLWVGDAGVPSGFAKATHNILETLRLTYDVTVLGLNYRGDPHEYPYPIWAANAGGDFFGVRRLIWMCDVVKPDVIVLQNDGWNIQSYIKQLRLFKEYDHVPVVAVVAVDGKNFRGMWLDGVAHAIFWTQFALNEAREGGYTGLASVIPLGVDLSVYHPMDKAAIRRKRLPAELHDGFIVGNVNRNQPRKRWDLLVKYFAEWINSSKIRDAYLYLHTAPTGDTGCDVRQLASYYGVVDRIALVQPETFYGLSEQDMAETYNCFDVNVSTTQGEGFGLTTLESMACCVPQILPDWSALGDWTKGAAWLVPCSTTAIGPPYVNVIGGVADEKKFVQALNRTYTDELVRKTNSQAAFERASEERFEWSDIGRRYLGILDCVFDQHMWLDITTFESPMGVLLCGFCGLKKEITKGSGVSESNLEPRRTSNEAEADPTCAEKENRSSGFETRRPRTADPKGSEASESNLEARRASNGSNPDSASIQKENASPSSSVAFFERWP